MGCIYFLHDVQHHRMDWMVLNFKDPVERDRNGCVKGMRVKNHGDTFLSVKNENILLFRYKRQFCYEKR